MLEPFFKILVKSPTDLCLILLSRGVKFICLRRFRFKWWILVVMLMFVLVLSLWVLILHFAYFDSKCSDANNFWSKPKLRCFFKLSMWEDLWCLWWYFFLYILLFGELILLLENFLIAGSLTQQAFGVGNIAISFEPYLLNFL